MSRVNADDLEGWHAPLVIPSRVLERLERSHRISLNLARRAAEGDRPRRIAEAMARGQRIYRRRVADSERRVQIMRGLTGGAYGTPLRPLIRSYRYQPYERVNRNLGGNTAIGFNRPVGPVVVEPARRYRPGERLAANLILRALRRNVANSRGRISTIRNVTAGAPVTSFLRNRELGGRRGRC